MTPDEIRDLQRDLSRLGFAPGPLDGLWGPRTEGAVQRFQRRAGLPASRTQTAQTRRALRRFLKEAEERIVPVTRADVVAITGRFPEEWVEPLNASIRWAHVTAGRLPAYLAQLGHESAGFRTLEEYASGEGYEGRPDLGNTEPGDGRRFKGRGAIQITGRHNYTRAGEALGLPLTERPELLLEPGHGFMASAWYWLDANLNAITDSGDFVALTRAINGGVNGLEHRRELYQRAQEVL
ncbi:MAG: peptidoglycan-binding protein, partial [Myxococcota bacterium]